MITKERLKMLQQSQTCCAILSMLFWAFGYGSVEPCNHGENSVVLQDIFLLRVVAQSAWAGTGPGWRPGQVLKDVCVITTFCLCG